MSESLGKLSSNFSTIDNRHKIYQKNDARLSVGEMMHSNLTNEVHHKRVEIVPQRPKVQEPSLDSSVILESFAKVAGLTGLVMTKSFEVTSSFGDIKQYVDYTPGKASLFVENLLNAAIAKTLISLSIEAAKSDRPVRCDEVRAKMRSEVRTVSIEVHPATQNGGPRNFICFIRSIDNVQAKTTKVIEAPIAETSMDHWPPRFTGQIRDLHDEIGLRDAEFASAKEEMQLLNEELKSTNEELQSSNEELQSTNEELHTLNAEYKRKIEELTEANHSIEFLLTSMRNAVIFLDTDGSIRRFNQAALEYLPLVPHDVGRDIRNLNFIDQGLGTEFQKIISTPPTSSIPRTKKVQVGGRDIILNVIPVPSERGDDVPSGFAAIFFDTRKPFWL